MSFLDNLRQQADAARQRQDLGQADRQARVARLQAACEQVFQYWLDLGKQLDVLGPVPRAPYLIDRQCVVEGAPLSQWRADIRKSGQSSLDLIDHVALRAAVSTGRLVKLRKDFTADIDKLDARLHQAGIVHHPEAIRHPDNGRLQEVRYEFIADIAVSVRLTPDYEAGVLVFEVRNLEGLTTWKVEFMPEVVNHALLDELARWIVGQPHEFIRRGRLREMREC